MIDLDTASRLGLVAASFASALAAGALAVVTHPRFTPHMTLVAFWSGWFGLAMLDLTVNGFELPLVSDDLFVANLNASATVALGGWAVLGLRLWHEARVAARQEVNLLDEVIDQ